MIGAVGEGLFEVGLDACDPLSPLRRGYGGDAANTLVMAARMGASTRLCSRVGDDAVGRELLGFWNAEGIDVRCVKVDLSARTGIYVNEYTTSKHRFRYYRRGSAGAHLDTTDLDGVFMAGLHALHLTGVTLSISASAAAAAEAAARRARKGAAIISYSVNHRPMLDPDNERLLRLARDADVVFISVEEARTLIGIDAPKSIHAELGRRGETIVTDGSRGATLVCDRREIRVPAIAVDAVDAAGAGDALAGSYLAIRLRGGSVKESLAAGVVAASLSCRGFGAAASYPSRVDVEKALEHSGVAHESSSAAQIHLPSER